MAQAEDIDQTAVETPGRSKAPWVIGLVLALLGGGGGFYAAVNGLLPFLEAGAPPSEDASGDPDSAKMDAFADLAFVPIEPLVISLAGDGQTRHLRFRAELEVQSDQKEDIARLMPRIVDVLNTYLRALSVPDLEDRTALLRLRAQMLRRVQIVTGQDGVNDLLIMEFVLN
jgi:flagellar FliL protein